MFFYPQKLAQLCSLECARSLCRFNAITSVHPLGLPLVVNRLAKSKLLAQVFQRNSSFSFVREIDDLAFDGPRFLRAKLSRVYFARSLLLLTGTILIEATLGRDDWKQVPVLLPLTEHLSFHIPTATLANQRHGQQCTVRTLLRWTGSLEKRSNFEPNTVNHSVHPGTKIVEVVYHWSVLRPVWFL